MSPRFVNPIDMAGRTPYRFPPLFSWDFTQMSPGALVLPTGLTFTRASSGHTVQDGANAIVTAGITVNDVGRIGRLSSAQNYGLYVEPPRSNFFPNNRRPDIWAAGTWASTASGNADAAGGNAAYRVTVASGGTGRYYATGNVTGTYTASAWHAKGPGIGTYQLFAGYSGVNAIAVAGTASNWARTVATATVAGQQFYNLPMYGGDGSSNGGAGSGARDALVDFAQIEVGMYPTSAIVNAGASSTRAGECPRIDHTRTAASIVGGRLGVYLRFRALAALTEMNTTAEGQLISDPVAFIWGAWVKSDGKVFVEVDGGGAVAESAAGAISWARYDLVEVVVEIGSGYPVVRYRVNGGAVSTVNFSVLNVLQPAVVSTIGCSVLNAGTSWQTASISEYWSTHVPGMGPF